MLQTSLLLRLPQGGRTACTPIPPARPLRLTCSKSSAIAMIRANVTEAELQRLRGTQRPARLPGARPLGKDGWAQQPHFARYRPLPNKKKKASHMFTSISISFVEWIETHRPLRNPGHNGCPLAYSIHALYTSTLESHTHNHGLFTLAHKQKPTAGPGASACSCISCRATSSDCSFLNDPDLRRLRRREMSDSTAVFEAFSPASAADSAPLALTPWVLDSAGCWHRASAPARRASSASLCSRAVLLSQHRPTPFLLPRLCCCQNRLPTLLVPSLPCAHRPPCFWVPAFAFEPPCSLPAPLRFLFLTLLLHDSLPTANPACARLMSVSLASGRSRRTLWSL